MVQIRSSKSSLADQYWIGYLIRFRLLLPAQGKKIERAMIEADSESDHILSTPVGSSVTDTPVSVDDGTNESEGKMMTGEKGKDSPAFSLRPRRSTPKPSPLRASSHKRSYTSLLPGPILESTGSVYTTVESVKRKLFKILSKDSDDDDRKSRFDRPLSPTSSIKSEVNLGVFVERIGIEDLEPNERYPMNYVCLRIIQIIKSSTATQSSHEGSSQPDQSNTHDVHLKPSMIIYAQEPDGHLSPSKQGNHDPSKAVIMAELHDAYALTPNIAVGKVIEVTKFETFKSEQFDTTDQCINQINSNQCDSMFQSLPFMLVIKPSSGWVPIISIKSQYNSINNPLLLTVDTTNKKSEQPSPGLRFTSYCKRRSVSLDDLSIKKECKNPSRLSRRTSPRTSMSCTKLPGQNNNGHHVAVRTRRSSSKNTASIQPCSVSPSSSTASSSSSTSTIITTTSSNHSPGQPRMNAIDFSNNSVSRVTKNSRRVSVTP